MKFDIVVCKYPTKLSERDKKIVDYFMRHLGQWVCMNCLQRDLNISLGQQAKDIERLRQAGYIFMEKDNRYGISMHCERCNQKYTHYMLLGIGDENNTRVNITHNEKERIISLLGSVDAFTGQSISNPEVDHKTPHRIKKEERKVSEMSNSEIEDTFQITTRPHNLLKDRICGCCQECHRRPPFFMGGQIAYYDGDSEYKGTCYGCGWYDANAWRKASMEGKLIKDEKLFELAKKSKNGLNSLLYLDKFKDFIKEFSDVLNSK